MVLTGFIPRTATSARSTRRTDRDPGPWIVARAENGMPSRDLAGSVLTGMLYCVFGSLAAGLLSAAVLVALVRLLV